MNNDRKAHLYRNPKSRGAGFELIITQGPSIQAEYVLATIRPLAGKREARAMAKEYNATPHNF